MKQELVDWLVDQLRRGGRIPDLVGDLPTPRALTLMERAGCGKPRAGAEAQDKRRFIRSHVAGLMKYLSLPAARLDVLTEWLDAFIPSRIGVPKGRPLPWPGRLPPIEDPPGWRTALFARLNAGSLKIDPPASLAQELDAIMVEASAPGAAVLGAFNEWYLPALLRTLMGQLQETLERELEELVPLLSDCRSQLGAQPSGEGKRVWLDSLPAAIDRGRDGFARLDALLQQVADLALMVGFDWSESLTARGSMARPLSSRWQELEEWLAEDEARRASEALDLEALLSLPNRLHGYTGAQDNVLLEQELAMIRESAPTSAGQIRELAPFSVLLGEIFRLPRLPPLNDPRWDAIGAVFSFRLVRAMQSGLVTAAVGEAGVTARPEVVDAAAAVTVASAKGDPAADVSEHSALVVEVTGAHSDAETAGEGPSASSGVGKEGQKEFAGASESPESVPLSAGAVADSKNDEGSQLVEQVVVPAAILSTLAARSQGDALAVAEEESESPFALPESLEQGSPVALARAVVRAGGFSVEAAEPIVWSLCSVGQLELGWHLARTCEVPGQEPVTEMSHSLVRCIFLASQLSTPSGLVAEDYRRALEELQDHPALANPALGERHPEFQLLLFSALFRPALLAPATGASGWLEAYGFGDLATALHDLKESVLDLTRLGLALGPSMLKGVREHAAWSAEMRRAKDETAAWLARKRQVGGLKYGAAINVWRHWLETDAELGVLFRAIANQDVSQVRTCRELLVRWDEKRFVDARVRAVDRDFRPNSAKRIEGHALNKLHGLVNEVIEIGTAWVELASTEPTSESDFLSSKANRCRGAVLNGITVAQRQVRNLVASTPRGRIRAAARILQIALDDVARLLDPSVPFASSRLTPAQRLNLPLLKIPALHLDEDWSLREEYGEDTRRVLIESIAAPEIDWAAAFQLQAQGGNHLATRQILDVVEATGQAELGDRLAATREVHLRESRRALGDELAAATIEVGRAVTRGLLNESMRETLQASLAAIEPASSLDFAAARTELSGVRKRLREIRDEEAADARRRLRESGLADSHPEAARRAEQALAEGNILATNEYIDHPELTAGPGDHLPGEIFDRFFPSFIKEVEDHLSDDMTGRRLVEDIRRQRTVHPIDLSAVPGAQARSAGDMLEAWYRIKNRVGTLEEAIQSFFQELGFQDPRVELERRTGPSVRGSLEFTPIEDRLACQLPMFGSLAKGCYELSCAWDRPTEELFQVASRTHRESPPILLYLGRMSTARRRGLAAQSRERRRAVLVIDEFLVLYLCTQRGYRPPVLFRCSLPFTSQNPYTTTAGLVPVEMFFGRRLEAESIFDRFAGTSLVFGGRQLGKTALLRAIARRSHSPQAARIVRWIDLKVEGLGKVRQIGDIWAVIAHQLHLDEVIPQPSAGRDVLVKRIKEWLDANEGGRILLLLDEADDFLEGERRENPPFPNVQHLKGLMDQTERRFKVVFAGLHNVQRTSREVNSPLAHLGTPVCIGPLLDNGEWREAHDLVVLPMISLGYRFESDDLPIRILSYTNYYPSLIQLFCKQLLDQLTDSRRTHFDEASTPPYVITANHVENAYQSEQLQSSIRDRFLWTLNLDSRYRVLALLIALETYSHRVSQLPARGVEIDWIRRAALSLWAAAFEQRSGVEDIRTVLDEMIGLGVLRKVDETHYALRSANLLNLLGNEKEIEDRLLDAAREEPPRFFEPAHFRREHRRDPWVRSPLTAEQETQLLGGGSGVAVVFGSPASGIDQVETFLQEACQGSAFHRLEADSADRLEVLVRDLLTDLVEGLSVYCVPRDVDWRPDWVGRIADAIARRKSRQQVVRVVFVGDAAQAWRWSASVLRPTRGVTALGLRPWIDASLAGWIVDRFPVTIDEAGRAQFTALTGNWSAFLHEVGRSCYDSPDEWKEVLQKITNDAEREARWRDMLQVPATARRVLAMMAEYAEPMDERMLAELAEGMTIEEIGVVIGWADLLNYVWLDTRGEEIGWVVDSVVGRAAIAGEELSR